VNRYVDTTAPWTLAKNPEHSARLDQVLYNGCEALRAIGLLVFPFLPRTGREIWRRLGIGRPADEGKLEELQTWGGLPAGAQTERGESLFPRIERA
jgi:methionyl-tRNA synthetase